MNEEERSPPEPTPPRWRRFVRLRFLDLIAVAAIGIIVGLLVGNLLWEDEEEQVAAGPIPVEGTTLGSPDAPLLVEEFGDFQ